MTKSILILSLISITFKFEAQHFISDSLMSIYVSSGVANKNFIPEGKTKKNVKTGKWKDYSFEFILTYVEREENIVDESLDHLLIQSTGTFENDKKIGKWSFYAVEEKTFKKYHIADVNYENGLKTGITILYYSSGEKAGIVHYKNDKLEGDVEVYYKNGKIERKYTIQNEKIEGDFTMFYKSGEKKHVSHFSDSRREGKSYDYFKDGTIKSEVNYVKDELQGQRLCFYPDGKIQEESYYSNDEITQYKYYYPSGQLWVHKIYKNGKYDNILELYDATGKKLDFGTLKDGNGTVKYYTEDAKIYLIRTFKDGQIVNEEKF